MSVTRAWILLAFAMMWLSAAYAQVTPSFLSQPQEPIALTPSTSLSPQSYADPSQQSVASNTAVPAREVDDSVFGTSLFQGRFAQQSFRGFNPDYLVSVGDWIDLKLWGAAETTLRLQVDSQGNIFVPKLGPVRVINTRNGNLDALITQRVKQVYRDNVGVYASLANAEPVKVFVTGQVIEPGLYGAYASDSVLHFLDRAGGIDPDTGSFINVRIRRAGKLLRTINLYDFLVRGELPLVQFHDGDTILVGTQEATAKVTGLVQNEKQYEFKESILLLELLQLAGLNERATHVQVIRNQTSPRVSSYLSLNDDLSSIRIVSGDEISVFDDREVGNIIAHVEGEVHGLSQYVLPYESNLGDLLVELEMTSLSYPDGLQLYRKSIAKRQREVLKEMLQKLEQAVLTARSGTREEAQLRTQEAELILKFIERARDIEPSGRLVLHENFDPELVDLQDRDRIFVPRRSNAVAVQGEVFFPSSFIWQKGKSLEYYLSQAGGLTQNGNRDRMFVIRPSGEMVEARNGWLRSTKILPGDEIMVLPQVDTKRFQFSKDLVQIIYQLALSAGVVLRL